MSSSVVKWVPLPDGRPWWPGIVLDRQSLDPERHASALEFWEKQRDMRGHDALNRDVLVLLINGFEKENESSA